MLNDIADRERHRKEVNMKIKLKEWSIPWKAQEYGNALERICNIAAGLHYKQTWVGQYAVGAEMRELLDEVAAARRLLAGKKPRKASS